MLPNKVSWKRAHSPSMREYSWACGVTGIESAGSLPDGVFSSATVYHDRSSVETLALSKPYGNIFGAEHFMYEFGECL